MAQALLRALVRATPKCRDLWLMRLRERPHAHTAHNANLTALCEFVSSRGHRVVVLADSVPTQPPLEGPHSVVLAASFRGLCAVARAAVIVTDGADSLALGPRRPVVVDVWHGVPLKGLLTGSLTVHDAEKARLVRRNRRVTITVSSSAIDRLAMASCMGVPLTRVVATGLPRYDWLVCAETDLPGNQRRALARIRELAGGNSLLLVAPTYRDWSSNHLFELLAVLQKLDAELKRHRVLPALRPHPLDGDVVSGLAREMGWPVLLPSEWPQTQMTLRAADLLLTDYSSIWVDYLLLDRPIVGWVPDLAEYAGRRGLLYDYRAVFPGRLTAARADLRQALLEAIVDADATAGLRATARHLFHAHTDARCAQRVFDEAMARVGRKR